MHRRLAKYNAFSLTPKGTLEFWVLCVLMPQLIHYKEAKGGQRHSVGLQLLAEYRLLEEFIVIIFGQHIVHFGEKARRRLY